MATANNDRAERARAALQAYVLAKGEVFEGSADEIADLITDLLHLAVATDDPEAVFRQAWMNFENELSNRERD